MSEPIESALSQPIALVPEKRPAGPVLEATTVSETDTFVTRSLVREFTIQHDQTPELGGSNTAPAPLEAALAALGSGLAVAYRVHARRLRLRLDRVEVRARGHLGGGTLPPAASPTGFSKIAISTHIVSPEPRERMMELAHLVADQCAELNALSSPPSVRQIIEIDSVRSAPKLEASHGPA